MTEEVVEIEEAPVVHEGMLGTVEQLAQVIGARPAGTEEEQQASFAIDSFLKDSAGLNTETEEFNCNPNFELPKVICCIASAVLAILTVFLPLTIVPALLLTLILAVLFALETFGISPLANLNKKGISQNIVAKYIPSQSGAEDDGTKPSARRKRKIIFIAHYDTGKVRAELRGPAFAALNIVHWVELVCMVLIPVILLIRFASSASDTLLVVLNVIVVIAAIGAFLPVISFIMHQTAQYNNGANCNAAGVAVMAEVARRVNREIPVIVDEESIVMSGEEALRDSGLIPDGASLNYEGDAVEEAAVPSNAAVLNVEGANNNYFGEDQTSKASGAGVDAIFEGIGTPLSNSMDLGAGGLTHSGAVSSPSQQLDAAAAPTSEAGANITSAQGSSDVANVSTAVATMASSTPIAAPMPEPEDDVPEWFKRGRAAAKQHKPQESHGPTIVQRSRFADALDAAAASSAEAAEQASRAQQAPSVAEQRLQQMRESIMGQAAGAQNALHQTAQGASSNASNASAQQSQGAQSQPADVTAGGMGVDGYLATTLDSPDYATAAAQEAAAAAEAANVAANASAEATVASSTAAALANDAAQLAAQAESQSQLEAQQKAAIADRTMGFIPVAIDRDEIFKENEALKNHAGTKEAQGDQASSNAADRAHAGQGAQAASEGHAANARKRREIALPSLTGAIEGVKARLQDAPIDDEQNGTARSAEEIKAERLARQERLSASLPSTNKASNSVQISEELASSATGNINVTAGAFIDASSTSSFEPVGDELISDVAEDEIYIEDADDSDYVEQITHTGALAGPGYVDMPSSRAGRVFGRFRKNKKNKHAEDVSLKDSLGLDDDFDAREVGKKRGGWESFRNDSNSSYDSFDDFDDDWNGGAFSKLKQNAASTLNKARGRSNEASDAYAEGYAEDGYYDDRADYGDAYGNDGYADGYEDGYASSGYDDGYAGYGYSDGYADSYGDAGYGDAYAEGAYDDGSYGEEAYSQDLYPEDDSDLLDNDAGTKRSKGGASAMLGGLRSKLGRGSKSGGEDASHDAHTGRSSRSDSGSRSASRGRTRKPVANPFGDLPFDFAEGTSEEREAIQQFKNGAINTEIWFVALGAELADNAGIKAFLDEHVNELRGSVIIDLNGLGAGELSIIEEEGMFRPVKVSSRLKRYANKAASALGLKLGKGKMLWRDSAAYISARKGYQTLHVAGMRNGKPAYSAEADDVIDNISEETLLQNADFVMELIHNI